jgi:hypothetical protein
MNDAIGEYFAARGKAHPMGVNVPAENNAPVVVFLLSDEASGVHGQVVRIDGNRLSLMAHPAVLHPPVEHDGWTFEAVRDAFAEDLAARQQPLGFVATTGDLVPYGQDYVSGEK